MTKEVKVLVGIPGSGKSYWASNEAKSLEDDGYTTAIISRDAVRFSMVKEGEDYFSHEKEVFTEFIRQINEAMELGIDYVFVDATHISPASRRKLLTRLRPDKKTRLSFQVFKTPLYVCLARNEKREGRARVPDSAICNMSDHFMDIKSEDTPFGLWGFGGVIISYHRYKGEDK